MSIAPNRTILLTPKATADMLGVTSGTLRAWRSIGRYDLPYTKIGALVMYRLTDVENFIDSRMSAHAGGAA